MPYTDDYSVRSPNFWTPEYYEEQTGHVRTPQVLVVHQTMGGLRGSLNWLCLQQGRDSVSAHLVKCAQQAPMKSAA